MGYQKQTERQTKPNETDSCNIVYLSGTIEGLWMREESAFVLIDPGNTDKKFVPCTLFGKEDEALADILGQFHKGDVIRLVGYVRPWSQKTDGKWENKCEVRITEIKSKPPEHSNSNVPTGWGGGGDSVPF